MGKKLSGTRYFRVSGDLVPSAGWEPPAMPGARKTPQGWCVWREARGTIRTTGWRHGSMLSRHRRESALFLKTAAGSCGLE